MSVTNIQGPAQGDRCISSFPMAFVEAGSLPIIPVTLYFDETRQRWRKQPRVEWDRATTDLDVVEGWWRIWPEALPGISLRLTDLCVVDADTPEAVEEMKSLRMLGPHSKVVTANGGLHLVFAQPPEPISRFRWSEGVEVLGTSSLLTCYDLEALRFPYVAPRAVLPKMFWKPKEVGGDDSKRVPKIKRSAPHAVGAGAVEVASLIAALWELDAQDWRGDYFGWFQLATACQALGISKREFVRWSLTDPVYAADERAIGRIWDSATPRHGGAFYAACAQRGIRINEQSSLYLGHPLSAKTKVERQPTRNWQSRINTVCNTLRAKQDGDCLFWAGCRVAEVMIDTKKPIVSVARALLEAACPRLCREIGAAEVGRIITNAFHEVEKEELEVTATGLAEAK